MVVAGPHPPAFGGHSWVFHFLCLCFAHACSTEVFAIVKYGQVVP